MNCIPSSPIKKLHLELPAIEVINKFMTEQKEVFGGDSKSKYPLQFSPISQTLQSHIKGIHASPEKCNCPQKIHSLSPNSLLSLPLILSFLNFFYSKKFLILYMLSAQSINVLILRTWT